MSPPIHRIAVGCGNLGECEKRGRESVPFRQFNDEVTEKSDTSAQRSLISSA
jgi:hypothetical protein